MTHRKQLSPKAVKTIALVLAALISILIISPIATNPATHASTLAVIQDNKTEAMSLSGLVTLASVAVSTMPDDTASSLAEELSDLATPLLLVVCVLYFEQFLLTALEYLAFTILVPGGLALLVAYVHLERRSFFDLACKLLLIALVCALLVPMSAGLTKMIEKTFASSIDATFAQVNKIGEAFSSMVGQEEGNAVMNFISGLTSGIASIFDLAKDMLSLFIDAVAILVITSCVIPILTALLFVWCIKSIIAGRLENFHDTAMDVMKRIPDLPKPRKKLDPPAA